MKFSKLIPLILLILILLVGSSCSCGGDGGTPTPTPTPTPTSTPTGTPTPTPTGTPTGEYLEHLDEENGFAILYPQDWEMVPPEHWAEGTLISFWAGEADMECVPQFSVTIEELSQPMGVEAWFEELKGNYTAEEGYTPISEEALTVDGIAAIKHVCSLDVGEATFEAMLLYVVEDTNGWTVTCICVSDCWTKYEPTFDTIVESLRLLD